MNVVAQQIENVRKSASHMGKAKPERIGTASAGDVVRQGDLYLVFLDDLPEGREVETRQLAPGSTQGSRHIAVGDCRVYEPKDKIKVVSIINKLVKKANVPVELLGPILECRGETTIEHPEHGHKTLPGDSVCVVVYQRAFAEEIRRVRD